MTIDNSASFSESGFQPNNLIAQMAELEVCFYSGIQGVNSNMLNKYFPLTCNVSQGGLHALLEKVKGDTQMTKVIIHETGVVARATNLFEFHVGYFNFSEKKSVPGGKLWKRYGESSSGNC